MKSAMLFTVFAAIFFIGCEEITTDLNTRNIDFNEGWKFIEDSAITAYSVDFDDSDWRKIDLPHDWSVEDFPEQDSLHVGPFHKSMEMGHDVGYLRGGTGWYRKHFTLSSVNDDKIAYLYFDGVQSETTLWVNGKKAGQHVYGYTPFFFNITSFLNNPGEENILAVKVEKPEQNSRWFTGAGIYRSVNMIFVDSLHIDIWGVSVAASNINTESAEVGLEVNLINSSKKETEASILAEIIDPDGNISAVIEKEIKRTAGSEKIESLKTVIPHPKLWDIENPNLYNAKISIVQNKELVDIYNQPFGLRSIEFSSESGFLLNEKPVLLKGGCMHHDNGLLGASAFNRAEYRRVKLMKDQGYNAIRCAHNPPSEYFLNACDELGILVIDETFDMWKKPKRPNDYHKYYDLWWKKDTRAMILRDRNHPSIIMWSIGNEIQERADPSGLAIAKAAKDYIKSIDSTRPVTQAICDFWDNPGMVWDDTAPAFEQMDIGCYNYQWEKYENDHSKFPERIICGSESFPVQADANWEMVEKHSYIIGDFVWVSMDYLGEATIGKSLYRKDKNAELPFHMPWPWYIGNMGDIDIIGNKKPQSFYRDVIWNNSKLEMAVHEPIPEGMSEIVYYWGWPREYQSWNWKESENERLWVSIYTVYPEVRLELNGKVIGKKSLKDDRKTKNPFSISGNMNGIINYRMYFEVPYEPGELKAVGIKDGKDIESKSFITSGPASLLKLEPERNVIKAGRDEIAYVNISMRDSAGRLVPRDSSQVRFEIAGEGELIAAGNANPLINGSFQDNILSLYNGKGLAILRSSGKKGKITVSAYSKNITSDIVEIICQ
jgi:beta-galactosidase